MDPFQIRGDQKLLILIRAIYLLCILVFWPLIMVLIWAVAIATALMPLHKYLSRTVKPSVSVIFITVWVLLVILLVLSVSSSIMYSNLDYIGTMVTSLVRGFNNTGLSAFLPTFTEAQFSNMPDTLIQLLLQSLLSLTRNVMQALMSIIIFFLSFSMLLNYGEQIWKTFMQMLPLNFLVPWKKWRRFPATPSMP